MDRNVEPIYSTLTEEDPSLSDLVEECVAELPAYVAKLRDAVASGDGHTATLISHTIKGSGGSHGFLAVAEVAGRIERESQAGNLEAAASSLTELEALLPRLRAVPEPQK